MKNIISQLVIKQADERDTIEKLLAQPMISNVVDSLVKS